MEHRFSFLAGMVLLGTVLAMSGCADKEREERLLRGNEELAMLRAELDELKSTEKKTSDELGEIMGKVRLLDYHRKLLGNEEAKLLPLENYLSQLDEGIAHYQREIEIWKEAHRKSLVGVTSPAMKKIDGSFIPNIEIVEVRDEEIVIRSNGEEMTLPISELAPAVREKLVHENTIRENLIR